MNPTRKNALLLGAKTVSAVVISAALIAGCSAKPAAKPSTANAAEAQLKTVKTAKIEKKRIGDPLEQVADVASSVQLDVVTKVGGDVQEILKKRGDSVNVGDVLFRLDTSDMQLQKQKAQIAYDAAQQQLVKARDDLANSRQDLQNGIAKLKQQVADTGKNYAKMRNDFDLGLVTQFQLDQMKTTLDNLNLDLQSSQSKLETLDKTNSLAQLDQAVQTASIGVQEIDRSLSNMEVKATASGVLTDLPVETGMSVPAGFRAAHIEQLDPIKITAELTEESAKLVRGKPELTFYIPGTTDKMKAKVSYLADVMNSQTHSYSLELELPNADRKLRPGMKAQILLTEESDQMVVTVPTLSVVREGGDTFVFVLNGDTAEKRKVQLGRLNETDQEVISGVKEGETLIVSGQNQLQDKEKVQVAN